MGVRTVVLINGIGHIDVELAAADDHALLHVVAADSNIPVADDDLVVAPVAAGDVIPFGHDEAPVGLIVLVPEIGDFPVLGLAVIVGFNGRDGNLACVVAVRNLTPIEFAAVVKQVVQDVRIDVVVEGSRLRRIVRRHGPGQGLVDLLVAGAVRIRIVSCRSCDLICVPVFREAGAGQGSRRPGGQGLQGSILIDVRRNRCGILREEVREIRICLVPGRELHEGIEGPLGGGYRVGQDGNVVLAVNAVSCQRII